MKRIDFLKRWLELLENRELVDDHFFEDSFLFIKGVLGYDLKNFHKEWWLAQDGHKQSLILAPRGHGKSTILTISFSLWRVLANPELRILIVSNTQSQAQVFLREIKAHLETNPMILKKFGELKGKPWSDTELVLSSRESKAKEANLTAFGVGGPIIARHYDIIILDDVVDEENARSARQREKLKVWYYKALLPTLEPDGEIHIIGTRYHFFDLYGYLSEREFSNCFWVYRAISEKDGEEFALWEEKFPLEVLRRKRKDAGSIIFNAQYQNDVELMKGAIFKDEWFRYYEEQPKKLDKIIGIDLALSEKKSADYFALVIIGFDKRTKKVYVLEIFQNRLSFSKQIEKAQRVFSDYDEQESPVIRICVEANAYQEAFAQKLRERGLPVKSVVRVRDKLSRAYKLQARFENGEIYFPKKGAEALIEELVLFPDSEHDDLFDALELAVAETEHPSYKNFVKSLPDMEPFSNYS